MARGETLGRTFAIPSMQSRFPVDPYMTGAAVPGQQGAINPALDLPAYNLGDLDLAEGLADQVVDQKGKIRAFALDMARRGVDVTQPDYTQPGGGLPFKTYQKMATNLMLDATRVVQSRKQNVDENKAWMEGKLIRQPDFDPSKQLSDDDPLTRYFPSGPLEEVQQANRIFQTARVHTPGDEQRMNELFEATKKQIHAREDLTPAQKFYNEQALVRGFRTDNPYNQRGNAYNDLTMGQAIELEGYDVLLKEIENIRRGNFPNFNKKIDADGNAIAAYGWRPGETFGEQRIEDSKTGGVRYAPRKLKEIQKRGDQVWATFDNTEDGTPIDPVRLDNKSALEIGEMLLSGEKNYGNAPGLRKAAVYKGYIGGNKAFVAPPTDPSLTPADVSPYQPMIDAEKELARSMLMKDGKPQNAEFEVDGKKIVVKKHKAPWNNGWYIDGTDVEELDEAGVIKYLNDHDYFDKVFKDDYQAPTSQKPDSSTPPAPPSNPPSPAQTESESDTHQKLISAYNAKKSHVRFKLPNGEEVVLISLPESQYPKAWRVEGSYEPLTFEEAIGELKRKGYYQAQQTNSGTTQQTNQAGLIGVIPELPPTQGETQGAYDLRKARHLRGVK